LPRVITRGTPAEHHVSMFALRRELSDGEWNAIALFAAGSSAVVIADYGATATQALGVAVIVFALIAAMVSRGPRLL
jgi:hypothetical protein